MPQLNRSKLINDIEKIIGTTTSIKNYTDRNLFKLWVLYMKGREKSKLIKTIIEV